MNVSVLDQRPRHGRAAITGRFATCTEVAVNDRRAVIVDATPDPTGARLVHASLERVLWQRFTADGIHSTVAGIRHRRPVFVTVTAPTTLALLDAGLPTLIASEPRS